jgi:hypothetical protein
VPTVGDAERFNLRMSPSVGKDGNPDASNHGYGLVPRVCG